MWAKWARFKPATVGLASVIFLGLALRTYHYSRNPPMWHDEAAQVMNILNKGFLEQLGPLYYSEAAPPLFMWAEKVIVLLLGDSTFSLRLLPFLASCLAFLGILWVGWRLLPLPALMWLGLLFACSDRLLWHCCEAKPYALDVLIAVGMIISLVRPWQNREQAASRENLGSLLLLFAGLSPILLWLSFPACFLLGGLILCLLPSLWKQRSPGLWARLAILMLLLGISFLALYLGPIRAQRAERLLECWQNFFPRWDQPWRIPLVLAQRWTEVLRYACEPVGNILCVLAMVGGVWFWQQGEKRLLGLLTMPLLLVTVAWLMGQYLIGPLRVVVFLAPAALLLIAAGIPPVMSWLHLRNRLIGRMVLLVLLLWPLGYAGYRLVLPWRRLDSAEPAAFVLQRRQPNEAVVGSLWEQAYYFRVLGTGYRKIAPLHDEPPSLPPTASLDGKNGFVEAFWLVGPGSDWNPVEVINSLPPAGAWVADQHQRFRNFTVVHVKKMPAENTPP